MKEEREKRESRRHCRVSSGGEVERDGDGFSEYKERIERLLGTNDGVTGRIC